jgi:hypothetical protein
MSHNKWKTSIRCNVCERNISVTREQIYLDISPRNKQILIPFTDCVRCGSSIEVSNVPDRIIIELRETI